MEENDTAYYKASSIIELIRAHVGSVFNDSEMIISVIGFLGYDRLSRNEINDFTNFKNYYNLSKRS